MKGGLELGNLVRRHWGAVVLLPGVMALAAAPPLNVGLPSSRRAYLQARVLEQLQTAQATIWVFNLQQGGDTYTYQIIYRHSGDQMLAMDDNTISSRIGQGPVGPMVILIKEFVHSTSFSIARAFFIPHTSMHACPGRL
jgi:hypothetical protein